LKANDVFKTLNNDLILEAVEACGFRTTGRCIQLNSMENRVFSVEIEGEGRNPAVVAKFYRPGRWSADNILSEHLLQQVLVEEEIPTPRLHAIQNPSLRAFGKTPLHERLSPRFAERFTPEPTLGKIENYFFCVWDKCAGRSPLELSPKNLRTIGGTVSRMHNLFENAFSPGGFERHGVTVDFFCKNALRSLEKHPSVPAFVAQALFPRLEKLTEGLQWVNSACDFIPVHGDLHRLNLLQTQDGGSFWFVDFDDCLWGPEIHDLWLLASGCDLSDFEHEAKGRAPIDFLRDGYEEFRSLPADSDVLIEPLRTLRLIYYPGWIAQRWNDPFFREVFSFFNEPRYWEKLLQDFEEQTEKLLSEGLLDW
jgi:Ser/Thr protein kinase RdoA (MazF antagonist)